MFLLLRCCVLRAVRLRVKAPSPGPGPGLKTWKGEWWLDANTWHTFPFPSFGAVECNLIPCLATWVRFGPIDRAHAQQDPGPKDSGGKKRKCSRSFFTLSICAVVCPADGSFRAVVPVVAPQRQ